jgi:hypothetical protein
MDDFVQTDCGLVFRPEMNMLGPEMGPLNTPMRTLYVDGSPESEEIYAICEELKIDYSIVVVSPGEGVLWHDHLLRTDFVGGDRIRAALQFALKLYAALDAEIDQLQLPALSESERSENERRLQAERDARQRLMALAIDQFNGR